MPLGIKQNNNLLCLTLDVWQDLVFLNEQAYPAGYFAANIMNQDQATLQALIHYGGAISKEAEALLDADPGHLCPSAPTGALGCLRLAGCAVDIPALLLPGQVWRTGGAGPILP